LLSKHAHFTNCRARRSLGAAMSNTGPGGGSGGGGAPLKLRNRRQLLLTSSQDPPATAAAGVGRKNRPPKKRWGAFFSQIVKHSPLGDLFMITVCEKIAPRLFIHDRRCDKIAPIV